MKSSQDRTWIGGGMKFIRERKKFQKHPNDAVLACLRAIDDELAKINQ